MSTFVNRISISFLVIQFRDRDNTYSTFSVNKILSNIFGKLLHKSLVVKIEMYSAIQYPSANFSPNVTSLQSKNLQFVFTSRNLDWKSPHRKQWAFTPVALLLGIVYTQYLMSVDQLGEREITRERKWMRLPWVTTVQQILPHISCEHPADLFTLIHWSSWPTGSELSHCRFGWFNRNITWEKPLSGITCVDNIATNSRTASYWNLK